MPRSTILDAEAKASSEAPQSRRAAFAARGAPKGHCHIKRFYGYYLLLRTKRIERIQIGTDTASSD